jgi:hypothetical protein
VEQRSAEEETEELGRAGVDVVVQRSPDAPQDDRPAGGGAEPEHGAATGDRFSHLSHPALRD